MVWVFGSLRSNGDEGEQFGESGTTNGDCVRHAVAVTILFTEYYFMNAL